MTRRLAPAFLLALALLCVAELVARVAFARRVSGRYEFGYNPTSGFEERADGTVRLVKSGGRRFHPQEFTRQRPADTARIFVVGDSVPRGPSLETSYALRLAERLRESGAKAEGFNLCLPGYGVRRVNVVLRQALEYQPSLVILHVNNSNEYEDDREWRRAQDFQSAHPRHWPLKSFIIARIHEAKIEKVFWRWLPQEVRAGAMANDADAEVAASLNDAKRREWAERARALTAESVALARARGVRVLIVTQALLHRAPDGTATLDDTGLDALGESLRGEGVLHLSMKCALGKVNFAPLFADGSHLRREGHAVLAAEIEALLREQR